MARLPMPTTLPPAPPEVLTFVSTGLVAPPTPAAGGAGQPFQGAGESDLEGVAEGGSSVGEGDLSEGVGEGGLEDVAEGCFSVGEGDHSEEYAGPAGEDIEAVASLFTSYRGDLPRIAEVCGLSLDLLNTRPPADAREFARLLLDGTYTADRSEEAKAHLRNKLREELKVGVGRLRGTTTTEGMSEAPPDGGHQPEQLAGAPLDLEDHVPPPTRRPPPRPLPPKAAAAAGAGAAGMTGRRGEGRGSTALCASTPAEDVRDWEVAFFAQAKADAIAKAKAAAQPKPAAKAKATRPSPSPQPVPAAAAEAQPKAAAKATAKAKASQA